MKKAGKSVKKSVKKQFENVIEKTHDLGEKGEKIIFDDSDSVTCELTDTGEDSKLVHRRIWSKVCRAPPRYLLVEFPTRPSDEYDSAPSRKYIAHFVPLSPVSVNLYLKKFILQ